MGKHCHSSAILCTWITCTCTMRHLCRCMQYMCAIVCARIFAQNLAVTTSQTGTSVVCCVVYYIAPRKRASSQGALACMPMLPVCSHLCLLAGNGEWFLMAPANRPNRVAGVGPIWRRAPSTLLVCRQQHCTPLLTPS
jgi:hypothetical protein